MMIVDNSAKTNWRFIGIIVTLTILVGGFSVYSLLIQQENPATQFVTAPADNEILNEDGEDAISETTSDTNLILNLTDIEGNAISFAKAELLLVAWGETKRLELSPEDDELELSLDEIWLRSRWERFDDMIKTYLYIQVDEYAPVLSEAFLWIGGTALPSAERVSKAEIKFPNNSQIIVSEGERLEYELIVRKPQTRYIRFIDDTNNPVSGVSVTSHMFWSASNHCGVLSGIDLLAEGMSDTEGRVLVPDGDFEYALELQKSHYVLDQDTTFPQQLLIHLTEEETTVKLHKQREESFDMIVTRNGKPVMGELLSGELAGYAEGTCGGAYWGPIDTTDENGRIQLSDFYPEQWERVYFGGVIAPIWEADPNIWSAGEVIQVELESQ